MRHTALLNKFIHKLIPLFKLKTLVRKSGFLTLPSNAILVLSFVYQDKNFHGALSPRDAVFVRAVPTLLIQIQCITVVHYVKKRVGTVDANSFVICIQCSNSGIFIRSFYFDKTTTALLRSSIIVISHGSERTNGYIHSRTETQLDTESAVPWKMFFLLQHSSIT